MNQYVSSSGRRAIYVSLALLFTLAGCFNPRSPIVQGTPPPFSCARFTESHWAAFDFGVDSPDDVAAKVVRLWKVDEEEVQAPPTDLFDVHLKVFWQSYDNGRLSARYMALFRKDRHLTKVDGRWDRSHPPTLAQVIDCLGFPQYYQSVYTYARGEAHRRLTLGLWYTDKGLVVNHNSFYGQEQLPAIHPHQMMDSFVVVAPGNPEQMVPNVYTGGDDPGIHAYGLCVLRPWPGSLEAIEPELLLRNNARCPVESATIP